MSRVYTEQTYLRIELTAGVDITGALATEIIYKKPSGDMGSLDAIVSNPTTGVIYYDVPADSSGGTDLIDEVGDWKFWAFVTFSDGRTARGETLVWTMYDKDDEC